MSNPEVSLFQIYGYIEEKGRPTNHKADHAIQTIWESIEDDSTRNSTKNRGERYRQCRIYVMDYTSFWKGTLTRQDWEAQRHVRCEDMVTKELYESLTTDAFKGVQRNESDKWGLALSVRSSATSKGDLELTWAGSVTNTIGGRSLTQKTILGTMNLEKVGPEESEKTLRQWIETSIKERQKSENLSNSLKAHVIGLDKQYKESKDLLVDFKLDKTRSQNDLMEKFRALINAKKEKIVKLVKSNNSLQERMESLENALKEERRKVAVLEGKEADDVIIDLSDIKKHGSPEPEDDQVSSNSRGRGRGRGSGRGRGRGRPIKVDPDSNESAESSNLALISRRKPRSALGAAKSQDSEDSDLISRAPLPHPQDGYGWDEDDEGRHVKAEEEEEEEERLITKRRPSASSSKTPLSNNSHDSAEQNHSELSANAQDLINRVSKAANAGHSKDKKNTKDLSHPTSKSEPTTKTTVKREESDQTKLLGRKVEHEHESDNESNTDIRSTKRQRVDQTKQVDVTENNSRRSKVGSPPEPSNVHQRSRHPVVSMRKTGAAKKISDRDSLDSTPQPPALKSFSSTESAGSPVTKRTRSMIIHDSSRKGDVNTRRSKESVQASIISEEDLYKELEKS